MVTYLHSIKVNAVFSEVMKYIVVSKVSEASVKTPPVKATVPVLISNDNSSEYTKKRDLKLRKIIGGKYKR